MKFGRKVLWLVSHHDDDRKMNGQKTENFFNSHKRAAALAWSVKFAVRSSEKNYIWVDCSTFSHSKLLSLSLCRPVCHISEAQNSLNFSLTARKTLSSTHCCTVCRRLPVRVCIVDECTLKSQIFERHSSETKTIFEYTRRAAAAMGSGLSGRF